MKPAPKGCLYASGLFFIVLFALSTASTWILELPFHVVAGWLFYLRRTLPEISWNWEAVASGVVFLVLSVGGFHFLARSIAATKGTAWQRRWSVCLSALALLIFGVSLAVGGIAHQVAWLARTERWIAFGSDNRIAKQFGNARQLIISVRLFAMDEGGRYPARLEELMTAEYWSDLESFEKTMTFAGDSDRPPTPWIYVRGLSESAPGDLPLIIAPYALTNGRRIIGTNDSAVEMMKPEDIRKALPGWKAGYASLGLPLPAVLAEYEYTP